MTRYTWRCPAVAFLREHYPERGAQFVADALGVDKRKVTSYASKIGVRTSHSPPRGKPFISGKDPRRSRPFTSENQPSRRTAVAHRVAHE